MPATTFDAERTYDDDRFSAVPIFQSDRMKVVCGYFEPGQFIPVHAPNSDALIAVHSGTALIREGDQEHQAQAGDIVVVPADTDRGIKAIDDTPVETLLVTAPPPTEAEHEPVRQGLRHDEFEPLG